MLLHLWPAFEDDEELPASRRARRPVLLDEQEELSVAKAYLAEVLPDAEMLPAFDAEELPSPALKVRQSTYNFSADVPELTRGRIVRLIELAEREEAAPRWSWALRSPDEALALYGTRKPETHLRQVAIDFWFDSAEERDRLVALAEKNDFLKLSLETNYARLTAPPDPAFLDHALARIQRAQAILARYAKIKTLKIFAVGVGVGVLVAVTMRRRR